MAVRWLQKDHAKVLIYCVLLIKVLNCIKTTFELIKVNWKNSIECTLGHIKSCYKMH